MTETDLKEIEFALNNSTSAQIIQRTCIPKLIAEIRRLQKEIEHTANTAAAIAKKNSEIEKQIADAPIMYKCAPCGWLLDHSECELNTHTAKLIDIQEIKK